MRAVCIGAILAYSLHTMGARRVNGSLVYSLVYIVTATSALIISVLVCCLVFARNFSERGYAWWLIDIPGCLLFVLILSAPSIDDAPVRTWPLSCSAAAVLTALAITRSRFADRQVKLTVVALSVLLCYMTLTVVAVGFSMLIMTTDESIVFRYARIKLPVIYSGLRQYTESNGVLPDRAILDAGHERSWRAEIAHLVEESLGHINVQPLPTYQRAKSWDDQPASFQESYIGRTYWCLPAARDGRTMVVGLWKNSTSLVGNNKKTILVAVAPLADINWLEPRDAHLNLDTMTLFVDGGHEIHGVGDTRRIPVLYSDGSMGTIRAKMSIDEWQQLLVDGIDVEDTFHIKEPASQVFEFLRRAVLRPWQLLLLIPVVMCVFFDRGVAVEQK